MPANTDIIHFCCDRYSGHSLKTAEQEHRYVHSKPAKEYEVSAQYTAPDPQEFFAVSENKANLLRFLCEEWCQNETLKSALGTTHLYLSGGFKEETRSVVIKEGCVVDVPALESTQQEADTRVILHTIYSVQAHKVDRVVIHANDTDIIIMCIYHAATHLLDLPELWVRTEQDAYLPIHHMVSALGLAQCRALPFIHSLSGRDTTSYPFFTGKKAWFKTSMGLDLPALQEFGENSSYSLSEDVKNQARDLTIAVYASKADHSEDFDLAKLRVYKFLNNRSTLLKLLPPTENAFGLHLKRAALAAIIDKTAHIAKPDIPCFTEYGWSLSDGKAVPCPSTEPAWPISMDKAISCSCIKGCQKNCSCAKKGIACYLGCRCQGLETRCSRIGTHDSDSD